MRPMMGGVETRGVLGAEGFGVAGLDQDSKKSSSASPAPAGGERVETDSMPSTKMPSGYLEIHRRIMISIWAYTGDKQKTART